MSSLALRAASPTDDRETVLERARWLARDFATRAAAHDLDRSVPAVDIEALGAAGFLAMGIPRSFGGPGFDLRTVTEIIAIIAGGNAATALLLTMQTHQHRKIAQAQTWPAAVRDLVFRAAVKEGALINALRVEPDLGSPVRGGMPTTIARPTPDGWRISGHKIYSTGAPLLRWAIVWAATDESLPRVGQFLVR